MTYRFIFTAQFDRDLKLLRKHNSSLRDDFESFMGTFDAEAHPVIPGTRGARKARMPAKRRGKGLRDVQTHAPRKLLLAPSLQQGLPYGHDVDIAALVNLPAQDNNSIYQIYPANVS